MVAREGNIYFFHVLTWSGRACVTGIRIEVLLFREDGWGSNGGLI